MRELAGTCNVPRPEAERMAGERRFKRRFCISAPHRAVALSVSLCTFQEKPDGDFPAWLVPFPSFQSSGPGVYSGAPAPLHHIKAPMSLGSRYPLLTQLQCACLVVEDCGGFWDFFCCFFFFFPAVLNVRREFNQET